MKAKETKYSEAIVRNLLNAERDPKKYTGKDLKRAKEMLGIRDHDTSYDTRVLKLVKPKA